MLDVRNRLDEADLAALAELEARTVAADGGRLKLEWGTLRTRADDRPSDVLAWVDGRLAGFVGLYQFGGADVELAGAVEPASRRQGLGSRLVRRALELVASRGRDDALLVCPRTTGAGAAFAAAHGGRLDHSEHAMTLDGTPAAGPTDPAITLRPADTADLPAITRLLEVGFGHPSAPNLGEDGTEDLVVERNDAVVGYLRLSAHGDAGGVYGFVVDPAWQGQGIGRDVLRRACLRLLERGARRVGLEVAVDNERALGLYTSIGFRPVLTEDYYRIPVRRP